MKITVKTKHWIPRMLKVYGITLYPYVLLDLDFDQALSSRVMNHEWVHVGQIRSNGWLKFYLTYVFEFVKAYVRLRNWNDAYLAIPYEIEAYAKQSTQSVPLMEIKNLNQLS